MVTTNRRGFLGRLMAAVALLVPGLPAAKAAEASTAAPAAIGPNTTGAMSFTGEVRAGQLLAGGVTPSWSTSSPWPFVAHDPSGAYHFFGSPSSSAWPKPVVSLDRDGIHFADFSVTAGGVFVAHTDAGEAMLRRARIAHLRCDNVMADGSGNPMVPEATRNVQSFALPEGMAVESIHGRSAADGALLRYDLTTEQLWRFQVEIARDSVGGDWKLVDPRA